MESYDKKETTKELHEITKQYLKIIEEKRRNTPTGKIEGYLLLKNSGDMYTKKDLRRLRVRAEGEESLSYAGYALHDYVKPEKLILMNLVLSYKVHNELRQELDKRDYTKVNISSVQIPEYIYRSDRFWKYKKTGYEIPFLKVCIEW